MAHQPTVAETSQRSDQVEEGTEALAGGALRPSRSAVAVDGIVLFTLAISGLVLLAGALLLYVLQLPSVDLSNNLALALLFIAGPLGVAVCIPGTVRLRTIRQMATPPPHARRLTWIGIVLGLGVAAVAVCSLGFIFMRAALG